MLLSLPCFIAYLLCIFGIKGYYTEYVCPPSSPSRPCQCESGYWSLEISCKGVHVELVREALYVAYRSGEPVGLVLECAELADLQSYIPQGVNVKLIKLRVCDYSSVLEENTFDAVADHLKVLDVSDNAFEIVPGRALGKLISLEYLSFDRNKLTFLHAGVFKGLHSLQTLSLRHNKIKRIDDSAFDGIGNRFWNLNLEGNRLKSIPIAALRNLSSLEYLYLERNRITSLQPQEITDTAFGERLSLILLNLRENRIGSLPPRAFLSLGNAYALDLTSNKIRSIDPFAFQGMEGALKNLHLGGNRLTEVPAAALRNLTSMRLINLPFNDIREVGKDDLLPYGESITHIFLQKNLITHVHPEAFFGLDRLSSLGLENNLLSTLPYYTYSPVLDTMELLNVYGNPLHCDCQMTWLVEYMKGQGSDVIRGQEDLKCALPVELHNMKLKDVPEDKLTCPNAASKSLEALMLFRILANRQEYY